MQTEIAYRWQQSISAEDAAIIWKLKLPLDSIMNNVRADRADASIMADAQFSPESRAFAILAELEALDIRGAVLGIKAHEDALNQDY